MWEESADRRGAEGVLIGQKVARGWAQLAWAGEDTLEEAVEEEERGRGLLGGSEEPEVTGVTQSLPHVQG